MAPNPKNGEPVTRLSKLEQIHVIDEALPDDREWLFDDALSLIGIIFGHL